MTPCKTLFNIILIVVRRLFKKIAEKIKTIKAGDGQTPFSLVEDLENYNISSPTQKIASFALIIDGDAINSTFHNEQLKGIFLELIPEFRYYCFYLLFQLTF